MPGLYRSPGLADIDVCFGKRQAGTEALKRTSQRYQDESSAVEELLQRPRRSVTLPLPGAYQEDDAEEGRDIWAEEGERVEEASRDVEMSDGSMHEGFGERRAEESGLPPTPPEALNNEEPVELQPLFADGVRNVLSSQKSGALSTTPVNPQLSPPTPDTTPPARSQHAESVRSGATPDMASEEPMLEERQNLQAPRPPLESFQTARETLPVYEQESDEQVVLPDSDRLPDHWLDDTRNKPDLTGVEDKVVETDDHPVSNTVEETSRTLSPTPPRSRYRFESPQLEREETDWEKHISYVSGPDELAMGDKSEAAPTTEEANSAPVAGLGVSGVGMEQRQRSVEDINNSVYKQIQQENIRRESAISSTSGAIRAGIVLPSVDSTPKSVRRRAKCSSLRDGPASEGKRNSDDSAERILKHERRHLPSRSALQDSPILVRKRGHEEPSLSSTADMRQFSSPARLGTDASRKATKTLASKLASSDEPDYGSPAHKLKRQSHAERLSKNMSVRRTSQEVSPSDLEEAFNRIDRGAASVRRQKTPALQRVKMDSMQDDAPKTPTPERQSQMNQGVKRSKPPSREEPSQPRLRKVIPSISSEPESPSSPRQVRRFSREERLENNEQLRRTSTDQSGSLDKQPSTETDDRERQLSSESGARRTSQDPSLLSSPRKSMDARFLQPTTTPMSVSGFSDRTADIEVCEASGVRIYPHNNNSLLVVQQGSRPVSKDTKIPDDGALADIGPHAEPIFAAQIDPPTPILGNSMPDAHVDSPLTNPRAAPQPPEPPSIQFIPPTPNEELERELGAGFRGDGTLTGRVNLPGRSLSFKQRVRRYSDSFFGRASTFRDSRAQPPPRDTHLSPMWRPQRFWDDYDSEDDEYWDDGDYHYERSRGADVLPPGGDTSHFDDEDEDRKRRPGFPRAMSKRLPGFRGKGGFLLGNTLGIDRHGTNSRRHYVSTGSRTLSRRASAEVLQNLSSSSPSSAGGVRRSWSQESVHRAAAAARGFKVPFSGGMRARWVGARALRVKMREARLAREERERARRREKLKGTIGMRVYHG